MPGQWRRVCDPDPRSRCALCGEPSMYADYRDLYRHSTTVDVYGLPDRACLPCLLDPRPELHHEPGHVSKGLALSSGKVITWSLVDRDRGPHHVSFGGIQQPGTGMPTPVWDLHTADGEWVRTRSKGIYKPRLADGRLAQWDLTSEPTTLDDLLAGR